MWLHFNGVSLGAPFTAPTNGGTSAGSTTTGVVSAAGGVITSITSYTGAGRAGDYPAFSANGARAIAYVRTNAGATDAMNPGTARLEFGADITLDSGTTAQAGSTDDGNNAVQRGLFNDAAQFKIQVDGTRPSCRVKGASTTPPAEPVEVVSDVSLTTGSQRYRVRCVRSSNTVTLSMRTIAADGTLGTAVSKSKAASAGTVIGTLNFTPTVPFSVGGKLTGSLGISSGSSDQFNGTVDNAILRIG